MKQKETEEQLGLASRLSRILLSSSNLADIGRDFVIELDELVGIDWGAIALIEKSKLVELSALSPKLSSDWEPGNTIPLEGTPVIWVAREKKALVEPDIQKESLFWTGRYWLQKGLRTVACMPLFASGEVLGAVIFANRHPKAFGERELRLLKYATAQLAIPIQYSKLVRETTVVQELQNELIISASEQNRSNGKVLEGRISAVEQALYKFVQASEVYAEDLRNRDAAIVNLCEAVQRLRETLDEQDKVLADLIGAVEEISTRLSGNLKLGTIG